MKTIKMILAGLCLQTVAFAQEMSFETLEVQYGTIAQNADGYRVFSFRNIGDKPLIISSVKSSCGCAVATWTKEPIMPQQSDIIRVKYDTQRLGIFTKFFTVESNDEKKPQIILKIKGEVLTPAQLVEKSQNLDKK